MSRIALFLATLLLLAACVRPCNPIRDAIVVATNEAIIATNEAIIATAEALETQATAEAPVTPTPRPIGATVTGQIIRGYGDREPVADMPLWIGAESHGEPAT